MSTGIFDADHARPGRGKATTSTPWLCVDSCTRSGFGEGSCVVKRRAQGNELERHARGGRFYGNDGTGTDHDRRPDRAGALGGPERSFDGNVASPPAMSTRPLAVGERRYLTALDTAFFCRTSGTRLCPKPGCLALVIVGGL